MGPSFATASLCSTPYGPAERFWQTNVVPRRVTAFLKLQANFEQTFAWKVVKVDRPAGDKNFATHAHGTKQISQRRSYMVCA